MGNKTDSPKLPFKKKTFLYRTIYEDIKGKIIDQNYPGGAQLPFERELCEVYGVDRVTVRKALDLLVSDGLVEKRPGLGSFVKMIASNATIKHRESRNILFVMSNNSNDIKNNPDAFNSMLFYTIEQECRLKGYSLFYAVLDEKSSLNNLINGNSFAGILFVSYIPSHVLEQCIQMKLPAICINHRFENMVSIVPEDERGSYEVVKYLQSQGHKKIGILLGKREYYSTYERLRGYSLGMYDMGLEVDPRHIMEGDWTFSGARDAILELLDDLSPGELPTAVFCCSDMMAIGALDAFKERGVSVPKQISIIGFDNISQSEYVYPRLTTITVDTKLMAELAVERIIAFNSEQESKGFVVQVPSTLVIRQSVKKL